MNKEQQIINTLKIRLFDEQEMSDALRGAVQERDEVLRKLVSLVELTPDENGAVSYDALIGEVEKLVADKKEKESKSDESE